MKRFKGQSTLEYVIILAAIVGAVVMVAAALKPKLVTTYNGLTDKMQSKAQEVNFNSR